METRRNAREFDRMWKAVEQGELHGDDPGMPLKRQTAAWFAVNNHSAFNYGGNVILWQSKPRLIGKHYWRLTIYRNSNLHGGKRLFGYEWARREDTAMGRISLTIHWKRDVDWPRYNSNDGMYGGMPRGLLSLYNDCEVSRILDSLAAEEFDLVWNAKSDETHGDDPGMPRKKSR